MDMHKLHISLNFFFYLHDMMTETLLFQFRSNFSALTFFIWDPHLLHQTQNQEPMRQRAFDKQQVATHRYDMFV